MNSRWAILAMIIGFLSLMGCATRPSLPGDNAAGERFVLERDLAGKTVGRGAFNAITGANRPFTAYLDGTWDGATLTLVEDFEFDDGEKDRKTWRLTKQADGSFTGTREDVVGEAVGFYEGDAFRLEYFIRLGGEDGRRVKFRDILYKREDGVVVNNATVGYFGLRVGRVNLEIRRSGEEGS